jgi:hypothetical protein
MVRQMKQTMQQLTDKIRDTDPREWPIAIVNKPLPKTARRYFVQNGADKRRWLKEPGTGGTDLVTGAYAYPHLARKAWNDYLSETLVIWPVEYIKELRGKFTPAELNEVLKLPEIRINSLTFKDLL